MYEELGKMEVGFFSPEEEAKIEKGFQEIAAAKKEFRRESRKAMAKQRQMEGGGVQGGQTPHAPEIWKELLKMQGKRSMRIYRESIN